jgi:hypothetical protein
MRTYEFQVMTIDRVQLRDAEARELKRLNEEGKAGWRVVHVHDDPRNGGNLVMFMERERPG